MKVSNFWFILFTAFIVSCNSNSSDADYQVGFSQCLSNHPWRNSMNQSMKIKASLNPDLNLEIKEAEGNSRRQIRDIREMIADGKDLIIISPLDPDTIAPVVEEAHTAGIPVILIDRKVNSESYDAFIGADNINVGRNAANYIASTSQGQINVVELKGVDNSTPTKERSLGFHQIVDNEENILVVKSFKGLPKTEFVQMLDSIGNEIDFIYAFNDELARQAWKLTQIKGLEDKIKIIGVDGLSIPDGGIEMVQKGMATATIFYPTGGAEAIELATDILNKNNYSRNNVLTTIVIDRFNAELMKNQLDKIFQQQGEIEDQIIAINQTQDLYYAQNNLLKSTMVLLAVILSLAIYSIYSIFAIRRKNKQLQSTNKKITDQRNEIEKIAQEVSQSNEAKMNFFTGISHEFKTPITLIQSSIESLAGHSMIKSSKLMGEVELIYNNSNRLLRLINNLLDFRKVEDRNFNLRVSKTNIYTFSKHILNDFQREAKKSSIHLELTSNNEKLELFIDRNLMDKVYFNLMSNAFKFTPENGNITINIVDVENTNEVKIHFKDSGIGIPKEEIKNVFDAFFRGSTNRKNSSGIGLNLTKQFIDLHLGKIEVRSKHGTEFIITLLKGKTHFNEDQIIEEHALVESSLVDFSSENLEDNAYLHDDSHSDEDRYSILIIEDNKDLSRFLKNKLGQEYDIYLSDGTDAIEMAFGNMPDIIICDVNLPEKSGFDICSILKNDLRTSHIPTVILTALGDKESYLKGLSSGTDLYLTKPFSYAILTQSLRSLLFNREKLRYYYINNIYKIDQKNSFGNPEQQFLSKLNENIKINIENPEFTVENLAEDLNISRVQLYRKVKSILGISISDYITNFKLENAKNFLKNSSLTVAEIAYKTGFNSPSYFSRAFKNKYETTPASYRKSST
ncbi:substrate-binding domain-containing protein [Gramella sp. AN32]|uniref:histidine kinase n=1 Tax=Christiangramia antarctica TaxID=2058158 RepID=A0ABW5X9J9_9FLAO|nr:substrate-binding domain-containing protein [Gramella sp. AN32]MCM4155465.1 AraC family transcriptional regulator [Gramella sp. AN32]